MFVFCLKKQDILFLEKSCVDFNFISLNHSYVCIYIALYYQELYLQDSCNNLAIVSKGAKIRNRYNQVPHLTQDTNGKVTNSQ